MLSPLIERSGNFAHKLWITPFRVSDLLARQASRILAATVLHVNSLKNNSCDQLVHFFIIVHFGSVSTVNLAVTGQSRSLDSAAGVENYLNIQLEVLRRVRADLA